MKSKWDHEVINSQEDEDGFSLNPGNIFNFEIEVGSRDNRSNKKSANTQPGSAEYAMISPEARRRISQRILSSATDQLS